MKLDFLRSVGHHKASDASLSLRARGDILGEIEQSGAAWFWASNAKGDLIYLSEGAAKELCVPLDKLIGQPIGSIFVPDGPGGEDQNCRPLTFQLGTKAKISDLTVRIEVDGGDKNRSGKAWWSLVGHPFTDEHGNFQGYRGSARDVTAALASERDAERMAEYDSLTGLANRHRMNKRIEKTLTAFKLAKRSFALMMLDLDRFKQVNDTLGHPVGDELLKQVGQRLETLVGEKGEIGRLGGDEFQILLPDIDDRGVLGDMGARIVQMISQPYSIEGKRAIIGTSVGIVVAPYDGLERDELVRAVDLALYAAKGGGRGQYRFYSSDLKDKAAERREIEEDLRDALVRGELEMNYQPLVDPQTDEVRGFEALMRWNHPERGPVSPALFIPIAEESNLINQMGEWALRQACEDAKQWPGELRVAVNVSAKQFGNDSLPSIVASALSNSGLNPSQLELEITESVFMGDTETVDQMFKTLKKLGVRLALDDFGTGYSSLGYLKRAPFDKIKIDQSFVRGSTQGGDTNSAIIAAIVSLANALSMETTAEGVEAMDELELVRTQGAHLVQGYIYSRPLCQDSVLEKLGGGDLKFKPSGPPRFRAERRSLFRKIGVIHEDHYYEAMLRNISKTGARIEGLAGVPQHEKLVLDLGGGQLVVCEVKRAEDAAQGVEFEIPLVRNGDDGLVTRHRVSPYSLAAAGMPLTSLPPGEYPLRKEMSRANSIPKFMQVEIARRPDRAA